MLQQTIPLTWAVQHAKGAVASGLSLDELFKRSLISPAFGDARDHITSLQLCLFYTSLVHATNDGTHAMVRRPMPIGTGQIAFRILLGSANLSDGIDAVCDFYRMCSPTLRMKLTTEGSNAFLALRMDEDGREAVLQEDVQLSYLYVGLSMLLNRPFPCSLVTTRDPQHFNLGSLHWAIRKNVVLRPAAGIVFPKALLAEQFIRSRTSDLIWQPMKSWVSFVEESIAPSQSGITNRDLNVRRLAAEAGVGSSTYRRSAATEVGSFRQQRERAILDAALTLLKERSGTLDDIAAELGYSDERSFRRFIKRATGRTPAELRLELESTAPPAMVRARLKETLEKILG